ncbi:hypothetical protein K4F52_008819 [Lecanicillium sp. MT-2017a]|nr:hypothetical protein K4F52_008819 [Lecanicillium sp. MT-2017a]
MKYSSYKDLWMSVGVDINIEAERLYWIVQHPLQDNVFVMDDVNEPTGPRQKFQAQALSDGSPQFHPIASLSLCEPPISSVTVTLGEVDIAADFWDDGHLYHDNDDREGPCRCCGLCPPPYRKLKVTASKEDGYVTIGDYVLAVHPWLVSCRRDFLTIKAPEGRPWPSTTELMVSLFDPDDLTIEKTEDWLHTQWSRVESRARWAKAQAEAQAAKDAQQ